MDCGAIEGSAALAIGEVRYKVFADRKDNNPWLARLRLKSVSPKGRVARWEVLDCTDPPYATKGKYLPYVTKGKYLPFVSTVEAIEDYQCSLIGSFIFEIESPKESLRKILAMEEIKRRLLARADELPSRAAASTG